MFDYNENEEKKDGIARATGFLAGYAVGKAVFGGLIKKIEENNKRDCEELIKSSKELSDLLDETNRRWQERQEEWQKEQDRKAQEELERWKRMNQ